MSAAEAAAELTRPGFDAGEPDEVRRWRRELAERVGMGDAEIAELVVDLQAYCTRRNIDPRTLLATWEQRLDLTVRRRSASMLGPASDPPAMSPNRAVESFLIHNGVNIFGDIVCVAGRADDLARQGKQFVPDP